MISTLVSHNREFIWKARGFSSIEDMNESYVKRWNETVNKEDDVYVLGDLMLGDTSNIEYLKRLKGKIHIVLGNHDTARRQAMYRELENVVEVEWAIMLTYKKYHFFLTHFPCLTGNLEKESLRQMTLNIYGHTHQTDMFYEDRPYMFHCGVDAHGGYPVDLDEVITFMKAKVKECVDYLDIEPAAAGEWCDQPIMASAVSPVEGIADSNAAIGVYAESAIPIGQSRCGKCVYTWPSCGDNDRFGGCKTYRRDPPDGGFYG